MTAPQRTLRVVGESDDDAHTGVAQISPHEVRLRDENRLPVLTSALVSGDDDAEDADNWNPAVWLVSAHGGAGATTLAAMCDGFGDAGRAWPAADRHPWCVVVCRENQHGLSSAQQVVLQAATGQAGSCRALGVITVADAPGKTPKQLTPALRVLKEIAPVWRVGWVDQLRVTDLDDLAHWQPGQQIPDKPRLSRKIAVTKQVPREVAEVAAEIFAQAAENHRIVADGDNKTKESEE